MLKSSLNSITVIQSTIDIIYLYYSLLVQFYLVFKDNTTKSNKCVQITIIGYQIWGLQLLKIIYISHKYFNKLAMCVCFRAILIYIQ